MKRFQITERFNTEFRFELYNMWNHADFGYPGTRVETPSTYGKLTFTTLSSREIQFGLKLNF